MENNELIIKLTNLNKSELINAFQKVLIDNHFNIIQYNAGEKKSNFKTIYCEKENKQFSFCFNISNLSKAYLPKDPTVKRRQISSLNMNEIPMITKNNVTLLLSYCEINTTSVFIAWNPFYFTEHKTNRSCYVNEKELLDVISENYIKSKYGKTPVYIFTEQGFERFISEYIELYAL